MSWRATSGDLKSKGSTSARASSLAGLHERRKATGAQYFTGDWIAAGIWSVLASSVDAVKEDRILSVIDTSVGSGGLLAFADTDRFGMYGIDIDQRCVEALNKDAAGSSIDYRFEVGSLENLSIADFDIAVINPPFSINLQSPLMKSFECTSFGRFGPNTSALSHEYALYQALDGASVVAALLPSSMEEICQKNARLAAIVRLPGDAFKSENARVNTCVFFFDSRPREGSPLVTEIRQGETWPTVALRLRGRERPRFQIDGVDESAPTILLPVTGDKEVRLEHHNRRIVLKFNCGLTQAKVLNGLLVGDVQPADKHRYPKGVNFIGNARLWLDCLLLQDDPEAAFQQVVEWVRQFGGEPVVAPTLRGYWEKLKRRHVRAMTPYRHWVKKPKRDGLLVEAKRSSLLFDGDLSSPVIRKGERLRVQPLGGEYQVEKAGQSVTLGRRTFDQRFKLLEADERGEAEWTLVEPGLVAAFPDLAKAALRRMERANVDFLWPFQVDGVIEHLLKPYGGIAGWKQGLGKARFAIALAMLCGKHNLIVVESCLINEMLIEVRDKLQLDKSLWRVIRRSEDVKDIDLRKVNIISYNTLKRQVRGRKTLAAMLRRRFHTVIADEGGILANADSQQSRALMALAARKLIVSDGTPIANYPRDILSVAAACAGDSVAHQPFGLRHAPFVEQRLFTSASYAMRGVDEFREKHVVLEWSTNHFKEDNRSGAKREVPRIANVVAFREWVKMNVQRKVRYEPEVEPFAGCPKPIYKTTEIHWDRAHLRHYLNVALHFSNWYMKHLRERSAKGQGSNLVAVLARIGAVIAAADAPHSPRKNSLGVYTPLTSKQRFALDRIEQYVKEGKKTILYAYSPIVIKRLAAELAKRGIESVQFHGEIPIRTRVQALNKSFRFGNVDVLLSSYCGQKGLNIPQGKRVIFYDRNWSGKTEDQAVHRTQRPDQTERVIVERLHITGSINEYMAQMVSWKEAAADSGLDWGDGVTETDVFHHLDSIIEKFCRDTLEMSSRDAFKLLAA